MKKILVLALMAVLSLGVLTACGGGGSAAAGPTINLGEGGAYKYNPDTVEVSKGTYNITLVNKDTASAHSLMIPDLNVNSGQIPAGQTKVVKVDASKVGSFDMHCDVPGHKEGGMVGKFNVK